MAEPLCLKSGFFKARDNGFPGNWGIVTVLGLLLLLSSFLLSFLPSPHSFLLSFFLVISILITLLTFLCKVTNCRVLLELLEFDNTGYLRVIWNIRWLLSVSIKSKNWKAKLIFLNSVWYKNISSSLLEGSVGNSALSHGKCCPPVDICGHYNLWMQLQEKSFLVIRYWMSSAKKALFVFFLFSFSLENSLDPEKFSIFWATFISQEQQNICKSLADKLPHLALITSSFPLPFVRLVTVSCLESIQVSIHVCFLLLGREVERKGCTEMLSNVSSLWTSRTKYRWPPLLQ